ncbi:hypothetical protein VCLMA_B0243 [Vibrio cholerae LMA3984-4]|nr:hypothetical protein VCLMA_B0243 [Vibrio cholerae LMA3984-4]
MIIRLTKASQSARLFHSFFRAVIKSQQNRHLLVKSQS